jgi:(2R)-3-sulfolactate dehydrogenase (NADP+)
MQKDLVQDARTISLDEAEEVTYRALCASHTGESNARSVARSVRAAERDEIGSHGLLRVPSYCDQAACGKIDGTATPVLQACAPSVWSVDARTGFAQPAIALGFDELVPAAGRNGIATLAVFNSHNCGVLGHHVEALAERGLIAIGCANTPAAIAPWGGTRPLFGTNPLAFAAPRNSGPPLVIDQSSSVIARGEVMLRAQHDAEIPTGWALDVDGAPTTDPRAALAGSMLPAGGYKGAAIALLVEVLAGALTGANLSFQASSFANTEGGAPRTGQWFMALDPNVFDSGFGARIETLLSAIREQPGTRLPGERRLQARARSEAQGITVSAALLASIGARVSAAQR